MIRIVLIALAILVVIYLFRRAAPRVAANPRTRSMFLGLGRNLVFLYMLRRAIPYVMRALSSLRIFR